MENRVFFPQAALDQWMVDGTVGLEGSELTILPDGRKYKVAEAVRVVREVGGAADAHELVGRVKARSYLEQLGAELVESSMLLGDEAYDVEPGWIGIPVGTFSEYAKSEARPGSSDDRGGRPLTEEDLLARFLASGP